MTYIRITLLEILKGRKDATAGRHRPSRAKRDEVVDYLEVILVGFLFRHPN